MMNMSLMQKLDEKIDWINDGYDKDLFMAAKQEIERLKAENERLCVALQPFAYAATIPETYSRLYYKNKKEYIDTLYSNEDPEISGNFFFLTTGHLKKAQRALGR